MTVIFSLTGFEISDVLSINDKDYSITFGLYFSVEWVEPRLNLSQDVWGGPEFTESLVPGNYLLAMFLSQTTNTGREGAFNPNNNQW